MYLLLVFLLVIKSICCFEIDDAPIISTTENPFTYTSQFGRSNNQTDDIISTIYSTVASVSKDLDDRLVYNNLSDFRNEPDSVECRKSISDLEFKVRPSRRICDYVVTRNHSEICSLDVTLVNWNGECRDSWLEAAGKLECGSLSGTRRINFDRTIISLRMRSQDGVLIGRQRLCSDPQITTPTVFIDNLTVPLSVKPSHQQFPEPYYPPNLRPSTNPSEFGINSVTTDSYFPSTIDNEISQNKIDIISPGSKLPVISQLDQVSANYRPNEIYRPGMEYGPPECDRNSGVVISNPNYPDIVESECYLVIYPNTKLCSPTVYFDNFEFGRSYGMTCQSSRLEIGSCSFCGFLTGVSWKIPQGIISYDGAIKMRFKGRGRFLFTIYFNTCSPFNPYPSNQKQEWRCVQPSPSPPPCTCPCSQPCPSHCLRMPCPLPPPLPSPCQCPCPEPCPQRCRGYCPNPNPYPYPPSPPPLPPCQCPCPEPCPNHCRGYCPNPQPYPYPPSPPLPPCQCPCREPCPQHCRNRCPTIVLPPNPYPAEIYPYPPKGPPPNPPFTYPPRPFPVTSPRPVYPNPTPINPDPYPRPRPPVLPDPTPAFPPPRPIGPQPYPRPQPYPPSPSSCEVIRIPQGSINCSPMQPQSYCYRFEPPTGYCQMVLQLEQVSMKHDQNCNNEYITTGIRDPRICQRNMENIPLYVDRGGYLQGKLMPGSRVRANFQGLPCSCNVDYRQQEFTLRGTPSQDNCQYTIHKSNQGVCSLEMTIETIDLECSVESLLIDGKSYCGFRANEQLEIQLTDPSTVIQYQRSGQPAKPGSFSIRVKQSNRCLQSFSSATGRDIKYRDSSCIVPLSGIYGNIEFPGSYQKSYQYLTCSYTFPMRSGYCYVRIDFDDVDIPNSLDCDRYYIEINNIRYCGNTLSTSTKVLELDEERGSRISYKVDRNSRWKFTFSLLPCKQEIFARSMTQMYSLPNYSNLPSISNYFKRNATA